MEALRTRNSGLVLSVNLIGSQRQVLLSLAVNELDNAVLKDHHSVRMLPASARSHNMNRRLESVLGPARHGLRATQRPDQPNRTIIHRHVIQIPKVL